MSALDMFGYGSSPYMLGLCSVSHHPPGHLRPSLVPPLPSSSSGAPLGNFQRRPSPPSPELLQHRFSLSQGLDDLAVDDLDDDRGGDGRLGASPPDLA